MIWRRVNDLVGRQLQLGSSGRRNGKKEPQKSSSEVEGSEKHDIRVRGDSPAE